MRRVLYRGPSTACLEAEATTYIPLARQHWTLAAFTGVTVNENVGSLTVSTDMLIRTCVTPMFFWKVHTCDDEFGIFGGTPVF